MRRWSVPLRSTPELWIAAPLLFALALGVLTYPGRWTPDTATQNFQINSGHYTDWYDPVFLAALRSLVVFRDNLGLLAPSNSVSWRAARMYSPASGVGLDRQQSLRRSWLRRPRFHAGGSCSAATRAWRCRSGFRRRSLDIPSRTPHQGCANRCDDGCNSGGLAAIIVRQNGFVALIPPAAVLFSVFVFRQDESTSKARSLLRHATAWTSAALALVGVFLLTLLFQYSVLDARHESPEQVLYVFDTAGVSVRVGHSTFDRRMLPPERYDEIKRIFVSSRVDPLVYRANSPFRIDSSNGTQFRRDGKPTRWLRAGWIDSIREHPLEYALVRSKLFAHLIGATRTPAYYVFQPTEQSDYIGPPARFGGPSKFLDRLLARWYDLGIFRPLIYVAIVVVFAVWARGRGLQVRLLTSVGLGSILYLCSFWFLAVVPDYRFAWLVVTLGTLYAAIMGLAALRASQLLERISGRRRSASQPG